MPYIAANNTLNHPTHANGGTRYDAWQSAVSHEYERLRSLCAALFENIDEDHEQDVLNTIYDLALKRADAAAFPPNRHARRKTDTA